MIKWGSGLLIVAIVLLYIGYIGIIFESFVVLCLALIVGGIGGSVLFVGVLKDRINEKEEEKENDYSEY